MSLGHAVSGSLGTAVSTLVTYPLDLVNTRLKVQRQLQGSAANGPQYTSIVDAFTKIYANEGGLSALFAGLPADLAKSVLDSFLFFLFYNYFRARLRVRSRSRGVRRRGLSPLQELAVGAVAGACSRLFTTPFASVVTRRQTAGAGGSQRATTFWESVAEIRREKGGFLGLWAGYSATLVLTLNPSITFFLQDALAAAAAGDDAADDAGPGFLIAAVSKVVATALTYPFQMAKAQVQVAPSPAVNAEASTANRKRSEGHDESAVAGQRETSSVHSLAHSVKSVVRDNIFTMVVQIAKADGIHGLYAGIGGEMLKAFFSHGITMLSKGTMHKFIIQLYFAILIFLRKHPELRSRLAHTARQTRLHAQQAYLRLSPMRHSLGRK